MPSLIILKMTALVFILSLTTIACTTLQTRQSTTYQTVNINAVSTSGVGEKIGAIKLKDTVQGLEISTDLSQLPSGFHGFHIHEKGSCEPAEKDGKMWAALGWTL